MTPTNASGDATSPAAGGCGPRFQSTLVFPARYKRIKHDRPGLDTGQELFFECPGRFVRARQGRASRVQFTSPDKQPTIVLGCGYLFHRRKDSPDLASELVRSLRVNDVWTQKTNACAV